MSDTSNRLEQLEQEIYTMMDYLESRIHFIYQDTYFDSEKKEMIGRYCSSHIFSVHDDLVEKCREKALQRLANIELANNKLFWCCNE